MPDPAPSRPDIGRLLPLYLVIFVAFIGYAMMITLFAPMLMQDNGFLPPGTGVGARTALIGVLLGIYPAGQFLGAPVIGVLSDRFGRKPVLLVSLVASMLAYGVVALGMLARSIPVIALGCAIGGLSESNIAIVQSAIADVTAPAERGRLIAWTYSATSVAYIVGPILGGQLAAWTGWSVPFWITAALLGATAVFVMLRFRETHQAETGGRLEYLAGLRNLGSVLTDRPIRLFYLVNFLFYLSLFGYFRSILIYMTNEWHMPEQQSTLWYAYIGVMSLTASLLLVGPLSKRLGMQRLAVGSAVVSGLLMILVVFPRQPGWMVLTAGPCSLIGTLTLAACGTILANAVTTDREGRVMGNNQALQVGGEALGAALGGVLAAIVVPLPLVAFGLLMIGTGVVLSLRTARVAATA
jgi:DHA1 family tetracycline resistance protein-like MFS transporter